MIISILLVILLVVSVPLLAIRRAHRPPPIGCTPEWQPNIRAFCTSVTVIYGTVTRSKYLMRRPGLNGKWQYRKMTSEQRARYVDVFRY